jgi:hypothetical protein
VVWQGSAGDRRPYADHWGLGNGWFWAGRGHAASDAAMERPYLPGAFRCVNAAQKYSGLIDRGEARQVGSEPSARGPVDALSGACRVVRRLSKHYAVREDLTRFVEQMSATAF